MIEFSCENCRAKLEVEDSEAGNKIQCPGCNHLQDVPGMNAPHMGFNCNNCGADLDISAFQAGRLMTCPHCGCMVLVPPLKVSSGDGKGGCLGAVLLGLFVAAGLMWRFCS